MILTGLKPFQLRFTKSGYEVLPKVTRHPFAGRASSKRPKLYVFADGGRVVYVGITRQKLRSRLHLGWNAVGRGGYYGYKFRKRIRGAALWVWYAKSARTTQKTLETIEAEIVYLVRKAGQWPKFQTEIHFHESSAAHRAEARRVLAAIKRA